MTDNEIIAKRIKVASKMAGDLADLTFHKRFSENATFNADGMTAIMPADENEGAVMVLDRMNKPGTNRWIVSSIIDDELVYVEFEVTEVSNDELIHSVSLDGLTTGEWIAITLTENNSVPRVFTSETTEFYVLEVS